MEEGNVKNRCLTPGGALMRPEDFIDRPDADSAGYDNRPKCGAGRWDIQWFLTGETFAGGYIVQNITMEQHQEDCEGKDITDDRYKPPLTYTEAWRVSKGRVEPNSSGSYYVDDTFRHGRRGNCTKGWFKITSLAAFIPDTDDRPHPFPPNFKAGTVVEAGGLLSISPAISVPGGTGTLSREFKIEWDCCERSKNSPSIYTWTPENVNL